MGIARIALRAVLAAGLALPAGVPARERAPETVGGAALCRTAAVAAARRNGVPERYMLAITLVETRRRSGGEIGPWPWTVNIAGQGFWFDTRREALAKAEAALASGQRSFDVGCFQLNYRWHGAEFPGLDAMFEPMLAADYAARFLRALHDETGDWMRAAGYYHSRTPGLGARYRRMVAAALQSEALAPVDLAALGPGLETLPETMPTAEPEPPRRRTAGPLLTAATGPLIALAGRVAAPAPGPARPGAIGLSALTPGRPLSLVPAVPLVR